MDLTMTNIDGRIIKISKPNGYQGLGDFYDPKYRKYTGIPSVAKVGNRVWTIWQTGGDKEPHPDNYCILTFSENLKEFKDSMFLIEAFVDDKHTNVFLPMIMEHQGKLWIFFWVKNKYMAVIINNPEANLNDITWEEPKVLFDDYLVVCKPLIINNGKEEEWLFSANKYDGCECSTILSSTSEDKRTGYRVKSEIKTSLYLNPNNHCHEPMLVEKNDGTYWMLKRIERGYMGGIEQAFSYDKGLTWTDYKADLGYPLIGPGSKFAFVKLPSGNILFVSHAVTDSRSKIIANLSINDGETFDYSLMLDERGVTSYPDIHVDNDGYIYIIYDRGRMKQQEIRLAIFNEEDIKASKFISKKSKQKVLVYKSMHYKTIIDVVEKEDIWELINKENFKLSDLPNTLTILDEDNNKHLVSGYFELTERINFKLIRFVILCNPNYEDVFGKLRFEVI